MGAIVAALYAVWKTSDEMRQIAKQVPYLKLVDMSVRYGFVKGKKIYKHFHKIFWDMKIEDTKIPLHIVAMNVETGKKRVFREWKIIDALRASISLPTVFVPYEYEGNTYIDGGVVNNLPIESLKTQNVIAVTVLKKITWKLKKKKKYFGIWFDVSFVNINFQILQRTILSMMQQNEDRSVHDSKKNVTLLDPEFWDLDIYHFHKVDEMVEVGYKEATKIL